jgi:hypothetical protein
MTEWANLIQSGVAPAGAGGRRLEASLSSCGACWKNAATMVGGAELEGININETDFSKNDLIWRPRKEI